MQVRLGGTACTPRAHVRTTFIAHFMLPEDHTLSEAVLTSPLAWSTVVRRDVTRSRKIDCNDPYIRDESRTTEESVQQAVSCNRALTNTRDAEAAVDTDRRKSLLSVSVSRNAKHAGRRTVRTEPTLHGELSGQKHAISHSVSRNVRLFKSSRLSSLMSRDKLDKRERIPKRITDLFVSIQLSSGSQKGFRSSLRDPVSILSEIISLAKKPRNLENSRPAAATAQQLTLTVSFATIVVETRFGQTQNNISQTGNRTLCEKDFFANNVEEKWEKFRPSLRDLVFVLSELISVAKKLRNFENCCLQLPLIGSKNNLFGTDAVLYPELEGGASRQSQVAPVQIQTDQSSRDHLLNQTPVCVLTLVFLFYTSSVNRQEQLENMRPQAARRGAFVIAAVTTHERISSLI
ncbi:hypothetical protein J6590_026021 [Homalodisca vitripennis]|nr:hypothetical protein J6590_026021 [Homalodisca vitripennis]